MRKMTLLQLEQTTNNFQTFIHHLFNRQISSFFIVFGRRQSGKTDFALLIAETLFALDLIKHIATNIKTSSDIVPIEHIISLDILKAWCKEKRGRKLFIFDEVGKALRRRTPMSSLNVKLIDELQILRKYKLSILALTPNEKYIDRVALGTDVLDGVFLKTSFSNPKVGIYRDFLDGSRKNLNNIPKTSIDFDTWDVAPFTEFSTNTPNFKDKDLRLLWKWLHGAKISDLGIQHIQLHRIQRKILKEYFELKAYTLQE